MESGSNGDSDKGRMVVFIAGEQLLQIWIVIPSLNRGGAERVMSLLAGEFALRSDLDVRLVVLTRSSPTSFEVPANVVTVSLNYSRVVSSVLELAHLIRKHRPARILSALTHTNNTVLLAKLLSHNRSTRVFVSERNSTYRPQNHSRRISEWVHILGRRMLYPLASGMICVSDGVRDEMRRTLGASVNRITAIPNPVNVDEIIAASAAFDPFEDDRVTNSPIILFVGRLVSQKNPMAALVAFGSLRQSLACQLVFIGEGPLMPDLVKESERLGVSKDVLFLGVITNPYPWLKAARVLLLTSDYEGFPNVLLEGLALSGGIVSVDCPFGPSDILGGGSWGTLIPPGEVGMIPEACREILARPPKPQVNRAREFSLRRIAELYLNELTRD